jgi:cell division protein FtsZ
VKGCAEIITLHGNINIDFADVNTVMRDSGVFIMGTGLAEGPDRAYEAVENALQSPLLDCNNIFGTSNILLNIISGDEEVRMGEIGQIIDYLQQAAGDNANIIWGNGYDASLGNKISVTIIATGFEHDPNPIIKGTPAIGKVVIEDTAPFVIEEVAEERPFLELSEPKEFFGVEMEEDFSTPLNQIVDVANNTESPVIGKPVIAKGDKNIKKPERESISKWFNSQFGGLFSDEDEEVK